MGSSGNVDSVLSAPGEEIDGSDGCLKAHVIFDNSAAAAAAAAAAVMIAVVAFAVAAAVAASIAVPNAGAGEAFQILIGTGSGGGHDLLDVIFSVFNCEAGGCCTLGGEGGSRKR